MPACRQQMSAARRKYRVDETPRRLGVAKRREPPRPVGDRRRTVAGLIPILARGPPGPGFPEKPSCYVIFPHRPQHTIGRAVTVSGFGYWSGRDVTIEFHPAKANSGISFTRVDLDPPCGVAAHIDNRVEAPRRTNLAARGVSVEMVEHLLAALAGLQIDNCEVHVDAAEIAGCDGSSLPFTTALASANIVVQGVQRPRLVVREVIRVGTDTNWVEARPATHLGFSVKYRLDYGSDTAIGRQSLELQVTPDSFLRELAPARTFLLQDEAEWLRQRGLGLRVTPQDLLVFGDEGPIDNTLRFENECVRHKALDMIGDLSLAGCDLIGHFVAYKSGHRLNAELLKALLTEGQIEEGYLLSA